MRGIVYCEDYKGAMHQIFSRLAKNKTLLRLAKGIYVKPTMDPELGALRPSLEDVARQIATRSSSRRPRKQG